MNKRDLAATIAMLSDEGLSDAEICEELGLTVLPNGHANGWWRNELELRDRSRRWDAERLELLASELPGGAPRLEKTYSRATVVLALARGVIEAKEGTWEALKPIQKEAAISWAKLALQALELANTHLQERLRAADIERRMKF